MGFYDRMADKYGRQATPMLPGQKYLYVFGFTKSGKAFCDGPFIDPSEADGLLSRLEDGEIFEKDTRDLSRATREIKAELLARGGDPDEALKHMLHSRGLEREEDMQE